MRKTRMIGLLGVLGFVLALAVVPVWGSTEQSTTREIEITAEQFNYTPNIIRVNKGDRVKITLSAVDVMHGLYLEGYGIDLKSWASKQDSAEFIADKTGKFSFRCSVTCGTMHPFMMGELIVEPNYSYQVSTILTLVTAVGFLVYLRVRKERR